MSFIQCEFQSAVLGRGCSVNVVIPNKTPLKLGHAASRPRKSMPVVYLLHGLGDNQSAWSRQTSIERYATERGLAVVMPDGGRGFYTDMKDGLRYWTFVSSELPEVMYDLFPISIERESSFAAGLSMGGYGALKLGLHLPGRFAAVGAMSAGLDLASLVGKALGKHEFSRVFGSAEQAAADGNDLFAFVENMKSFEGCSRILHICGADDFIVDGNRRFAGLMNQSGYPYYEYREFEGGHDWRFWDLHIQEILDFFVK
ncbi:MAG: esterase family protein [Victivallaceae bacterium]|nr:esterase family protein [Victivallaceae bacterium]